MLRIGHRQGQVSVMLFARSVQCSLGQAAPAHPVRATVTGMSEARLNWHAAPAMPMPAPRRCPPPTPGGAAGRGDEAAKLDAHLGLPRSHGDRALHCQLARGHHDPAARAQCGARARGPKAAARLPAGPTSPRPSSVGLAVRNPSHNGTHFSKEGGNGGGSAAAASRAARCLNRAHTTKASVG
jgi:hypothetical protein